MSDAQEAPTEEGLQQRSIVDSARLVGRTGVRRAHAVTILHGNKSAPGKPCRGLALAAFLRRHSSSAGYFHDQPDHPVFRIEADFNPFALSYLAHFVIFSGDDGGNGQHATVA
jgi:hypothetical protein